MPEQAGLLQSGLNRLAELLGPGWEIAPLNVARPIGGNDVNARGSSADLVWTVRDAESQGQYGEILVEARSKLTPAAAADLLTAQVELVRSLRGQVSVLVIAPWLSPRTRTVLDGRGFGYLDLTGNVRLRMRRPTILIDQAGAARDPAPSRQGDRGLRGSQAGRLARVLVDCVPPYRGQDLATAAGVSPGYVSRLLSVLEDEALISRQGRTIVDVDWSGVLRARAAEYDLLRANAYASMVARKGLASVLDTLAEKTTRKRVLVTGPVAAQAVAPLAVGGQLMIYVNAADTEALAKRLGLLRGADRAGAVGDVLLLNPPNDAVFERDAPLEGFPGLRRVGLSQLALDCLSGPGRMPAEGEAILDVMAADVGAWRYNSLSRARASRGNEK